MKKKHMLLESMLPEKQEKAVNEMMFHGLSQISDIKSHVETSSVLPTSFKEFFLREWELFEVDVERGKIRQAYYGLEEYEDELQYALKRSPGEFEEVYKPMFDELRSALEQEMNGEEDDDDNWDTTDRDDVHPAGWPGMTEARDISDPALVASRSRNDDFQNGDKVKITSKLNRYRGATGEIHDLHDDGTAMVILDDPKRTTITVNLGQIEKLTDDSWDTMDRDDVHPAGWPGMTEVKNFDIVNYLKENRMFKKNTL